MKKTRHPRVAIVEDDAEFRGMLRRWLSPQYDVVDFSCAEDVLESEVDQFRADLIITDVKMKGLNGFRLCETLRTHPRYSHVPVLLLTGVAPGEGLMRGQEAGASAYLTKPIERERLLEQIDKLLDVQAF